MWRGKPATTIAPETEGIPFCRKPSSHFCFPQDKIRLSKIQTERAPVPIDPDKSKGAVIRASKFILVYDKLPEHQ